MFYLSPETIQTLCTVLFIVLFLGGLFLIVRSSAGPESGYDENFNEL
jgi:hypothetical protein